jgi:CRP/FNR family transcriptional regulator, cyclic AMP receptor protein
MRKSNKAALRPRRKMAGVTRRACGDVEGAGAKSSGDLIAPSPHRRRLMSAEVQTEPIATRVALHPFLAGMNRAQLALLTDCAMATHFKKRENILREGEFANRLYLIETGKVVLESVGSFAEPLAIETIGAGDLLGWSWMFPPYVWHFTARAIEPTTAIIFYGMILREHCEKNHSLGYELLKRISAVMVKRLQAGHKQMLSAHLHDASFPTS